MNARRFLVIAVLAATAGGCTVGSGSGEVKGPLFIHDCRGDEDFGPGEFNLQPDFFAAEQLLDISSSSSKSNRLIIRLQTSGRRREANDILRFDIPNSGAVARCVAGRMTDAGAPDSDPLNCFQGPMGPVLRVAPNALVRAYLTPNFTCRRQIVGTAIAEARPQNDGAWQSWIRLTSFGRAAQATSFDNFKIDIDDRLHAPAFSLTIEDDAVVTAKMDVLQPPVPEAHIGGMLTGHFDFDMQRGQGAQTFP